MRKISVVAISVVLSMFCTFALAISHDDALKAYGAGDFEAAFKIWRPLAEDGDARAQFRVGELYIEGKGVAKNLAHARKWIEAAAQQGYTKAEHRMGEIYRFGIGVTANADTSYDWYLRAVKKKYAPADLGISELVLFHFAQTEETLQGAVPDNRD